MKAKILLFATIIANCLLPTVNLFSQTPGEWTWMHGDSTAPSLPVFGVQGVPGPANKPPALYEPCEWKDKNGNFWLYGGQTSNLHAALWKFDPNPASPTYNQWTWMNGPSTFNQAPVYGTQGVPSPTNQPGGRSWGTVTWVDALGNLWLFGGQGSLGMYNDLWKYDPNPSSPTYNQWTWMKGPSTGNDPGSFGTKGVSLPTNVPHSRYETSCSWTDNAGNLWLYGGAYTAGYLGDLWKYDISTNDWTWMHGANTGANTLDILAVYGTQGVADPANTPGGRFVYCSWTDLSGNFWLIGAGYGSQNKNALWKYDPNPASPTYNQWTWMKGPKTTDDPGNYGNKCVSASSNVPPARTENRARVRDACGNFWNFGGGINNSGNFNLNDLWHYNVSTNQWTWVSGDNIPNQAAVYGTLGVSNPANKPEAKFGSVAWIDNNGYIWIFGGLYGDNTNSLFRYVPDSACVPFSALVTVSSNTTICIGQSATLTATGGTSYSWTAGGQSTSSIVVNPTTSTTYTVIGSGACGSASDSVTVTVASLPVAAIIGNDTICAGDNAILTASGGGNYLWNIGTTQASITANPSVSTIYSTTVSVGSCTASATFSLTVEPPPVATAWNNVTITAGNSSTLNSSGNPAAVTYSWSPATGLSCITCQNPVATPMITTPYCVTVTDANGCKDIACVIVTVEPQDCSSAEKFYLPNAFSPNGDGENDEFCLQGTIEDCMQELTITIYDRWGEKVFESEDQNFCWDGKYKDKFQNTAVFVYCIEATFIDGKEISKKGNISLIK